MAKKVTVYTLEKSRSGRGTQNDSTTTIKRTLPDLLQYFGYTLEIGHSWNSKISRYPKTIKSFMKNLQMSYEEKEAACYSRTYVNLVNTEKMTEEEYEVAKKS